MTLCQHYPARLVCGLLDFPRCQLYRRPVPPAPEEADLREALQRLAGEGPTYRYRPLTALLRREGGPATAHRVRRLITALLIPTLPPDRPQRPTNTNPP